jgi:hypothetical protein
MYLTTIGLAYDDIDRRGKEFISYLLTGIRGSGRLGFGS